MTGIHNCSPSFLARVVFPAPARPVTMMHFGFLFMFLNAQRFESDRRTTNSDKMHANHASAVIPCYAASLLSVSIFHSFIVPQHEALTSASRHPTIQPTLFHTAVARGYNYYMQHKGRDDGAKTGNFKPKGKWRRSQSRCPRPPVR